MEARPPRESLNELLTIEDRGHGRFAATPESFWGGTARGDVLARATLAACSGADAIPSAHQASFFARALPDRELTLSREELAPGWRRVRAEQQGALVCDVTFRFAPAGDGLSYQSAAPERGLPAPESLPSEMELGRAEGWERHAVGPVESRRIGDRTPVKEHEPAVWLGWLAPRTPLVGGAVLQAAALAFLSEYRSHWAVERRLGPAFPRSDITLEGHALWVHRALPWDDFWLVRTSTDIGVGGRCLSRREIFTRAGALVASAAWEARVRGS